MTDREMLELAAKSVRLQHEGYIENYDDDPRGTGPGLQTQTPEGGIYVWNPLADDGDALRLAAALQISVLFQVSGVEARAYRGEFCIAREAATYENRDETKAVTRRAIVRAAAFSVGVGKTPNVANEAQPR